MSLSLHSPFLVPVHSFHCATILSSNSSHHAYITSPVLHARSRHSVHPASFPNSLSSPVFSSLTLHSAPILSVHKLASGANSTVLHSAPVLATHSIHSAIGESHPLHATRILKCSSVHSLINSSFLHSAPVLRSSPIHSVHDHSRHLHSTPVLKTYRINSPNANSPTLHSAPVTRQQSHHSHLFCPPITPAQSAPIQVVTQSSNSNHSDLLLCSHCPVRDLHCTKNDSVLSSLSIRSPELVTTSSPPHPTPLTDSSLVRSPIVSSHGIDFDPQSGPHSVHSLACCSHSVNPGLPVSNPSPVVSSNCIDVPVLNSSSTDSPPFAHSVDSIAQTSHSIDPNPVLNTYSHHSSISASNLMPPAACLRSVSPASSPCLCSKPTPPLSYIQTPVVGSQSIVNSSSILSLHSPIGICLPAPPLCSHSTHSINSPHSIHPALSSPSIYIVTILSADSLHRYPNMRRLSQSAPDLPSPGVVALRSHHYSHLDPGLRVKHISSARYTSGG
ncbi:mucin-4-like [Pectinophora gossypiella]|uniref:mucin-4-like n=1 Tax=Pectinophora gossypiella TaxID=13191 RepID=UPI00214EAAFC|nr:mucin-4-like [Pectinophora gossypiella]